MKVIWEWADTLSVVRATAQKWAVSKNLATRKAPIATCIFLDPKACLLLDAEVLDQAWATAVLAGSTVKAHSMQSTGKCVTLGFQAPLGYS